MGGHSALDKVWPLTRERPMGFSHRNISSCKGQHVLSASSSFGAPNASNNTYVIYRARSDTTHVMRRFLQLAMRLTMRQPNGPDTSRVYSVLRLSLPLALTCGRPRCMTKLWTSGDRSWQSWRPRMRSWLCHAIRRLRLLHFMGNGRKWPPPGSWTLP